MKKKKIYICPECEVTFSDELICEMPTVSRIQGSSGSGNGGGTGSGAPGSGGPGGGPGGGPAPDAKEIDLSNQWSWDDDEEDY